MLLNRVFVFVINVINVMEFGSWGWVLDLVSLPGKIGLFSSYNLG